MTPCHVTRHPIRNLFRGPVATRSLTLAVIASRRVRTHAARTRAYTHSHTHSLSLTHAHAHARAHTHTHTHTGRREPRPYTSGPGPGRAHTSRPYRPHGTHTHGTECRVLLRQHAAFGCRHIRFIDSNKGRYSAQGIGFEIQGVSESAAVVSGHPGLTFQRSAASFEILTL